MRANLQFAFLIAVFGTTNAGAATTFFNDRTAFDTAAGATSAETFNSYLANVQTSPTAFDTGTFTIGVVGTPDPSANRIDVIRNGQSRPIDATPYLLARTNKDTQQIVINFDQSIGALGFDLADFNDFLLPTTRILVAGTIFSPAIQPDNSVGFYGFVSDTPFNSVTFETVGGVDSFGIDNISYKTVTAAVTTYLDRLLFDSVVGRTQREDFDSFVADTPTSPAALTIGDFTVSVTGIGDPTANRVDVGRNVQSRPVDTTPYLLARTNSGPQQIILDFTDPIDAIGFDVADFNDFLSPLSRVTIAGQTFAPAIANTDTPGFFGFTSMTSFTRITFDSIGSVDAFGIDNLVYRKVSAAVPEPSTWAMFLCAFALCGAQLRRRHRMQTA